MIAPRLTPPSFVAPNGTVKQGTGSVLAIGFAILLLLFAGTWGYLAFRKGEHSNFDDGLIGGCLLGAIALALPADLQQAVNVIKPALPWGRRRDDA